MVESKSSSASTVTREGPAQADLDKCVHCGLCLNACPTYRELGVEMDSPRGRIQQMINIVGGEPINESYIQHMELCLACRGCETACPSGVPYGRMIEAARAEIESHKSGPCPAGCFVGSSFIACCRPASCYRLRELVFISTRRPGSSALSGRQVLNVLGNLGGDRGPDTHGGSSVLLLARGQDLCR